MATIEEVRDLTLQRLRVMESGGTAKTDDAATIDDDYQNLHSWLVSKKAVTWDNDDDIPEDSVYHTVTILAARNAEEFGVPHRNQLQIEAYGIPNSTLGALGELIDLAKSDYIPTVTKALYY